MIISIKYYIPFSVELFKIYIKYIALFMFFFFPSKTEFRANDDFEDCYRSEHDNDTISSFSFLSIKGKKQVRGGTRAYGNQRKGDDESISSCRRYRMSFKDLANVLYDDFF